MDDDWYGGSDKIVSLPWRAMPARLPDPATIPPREWLYGTRLIRRFVTVTVAPGGTGKSMYAIGVGMCLASGKSFLRDTVFHRVNSWIINLEDPMEELERRVASMMIRHNISRDELDGRLFLHSGRDRRLTIAQQTEYGEITYPDRDAIVEAARAAEIGHMVIDPFIKSHGLEENSNPHMDAAATAWSDIGQQVGAAIDLIHHTRKANGGATDVDSARGGKALTDASRVSQTMGVMTPEEAEKLGIQQDKRWQYVRLDDAKANMAPRATDARWFQLEMVPLHNGTEEYPHGDNVAAIVPWDPPTPFQGLTWPMLSAILARIERGPELDEMYSPSRRGKTNDRWAGHAFTGICDKTDGQRQDIINRWLKEGVLEETEYKSRSTRKIVTGCTVNTRKVEEMRGEMGGHDAD